MWKDLNGNNHQDEVKSNEWTRQVDLIKKGTSLLFTNDFAGAERIFESGFQNLPDPPPLPCRDLRSSFAFKYALASLIQGLSSMENDQLDDCLDRVWKAEELSHVPMEYEWTGHRLTRGICYLFAGIVYVLKHVWVKAGWNLVKAWNILGNMKAECDSFQDQIEGDVIISAYSFMTGLFNLIISLLPSTLVKVSGVLGFEGDRAKSLEILQSCWKAGGILSPYACMVSVVYFTDLKGFMGESVDDDGFKYVFQSLDAADKIYPESLVFNYLRTNAYCAQGKIEMAVNQLENHILNLSIIHDHPAIDMLICHKRGTLALLSTDYETALACFEKAIRINEKVTRRTWVPVMSLVCVILNSLLEQDDNNTCHHERIFKYEKMDKKSWRQEDKWAFRKNREYVDEHIKNPLLDLIDLKMTILHTLSKTTTHSLYRLLKELNEHVDYVDGVGDLARCEMAICEITRLLLKRNQVVYKNDSEDQFEDLVSIQEKIERVCLMDIDTYERSIRNATLSLAHYVYCRILIDRILSSDESSEELLQKAMDGAQNIGTEKATDFDLVLKFKKNSIDKLLSEMKSNTGETENSIFSGLKESWTHNISTLSSWMKS